METENKLLILVCVIILIFFTCFKHNNIEEFINSCQYYNLGDVHGYDNRLKKQIGRPGIEVMNEKLSSPQYVAGWLRRPKPVYKYECKLDENLKNNCQWTQIYKNFYPNLRGNQENMIQP